MMHLQPVQVAHLKLLDYVDPDAPEDLRKRVSKHLVAYTRPTQRRGTYKVVDMVSDAQRLALAAWANDYEHRRMHGVNLVWESVHGTVPAHS